MNKIIKAELISIGNELLSGITVNTNASWLGRKLAESGIEVNWVTTVTDTPSEIESALQISLERADVIISTGGLGPTPDDLTRQAIGRFFNTNLILHEGTLEKIKKIFEGRNLIMPEINQVQAMVPEAANLIPNPTGTAPGLELVKDGKIFYFLPGVPLEMKLMVEQVILEKLKTRFTLQTIPGHLFRTTGLPESKVYEKIADILNRYPEFQVAFLPKSSGIDIRLKNFNFTSEAERKFGDCLHEIKSSLDKYIYTEVEATLPEIIGRILTEKKMTLSIAESFTGGLVSDWITNVPGSSLYFLGSVITYSNFSKIKQLKVSVRTLESVGAVSEQCAQEMVVGAQKLFRTTCAIATTGIAGPTGATDSKPVGLCYLAALSGEEVRVRQFNFGKDRRTNKERGTAAALELLRRMLLRIE